MTIINQFYIYLLILLLSSCAIVQSPSGGDKDVIPPKLESSSPQNGTKNFKGPDIYLAFEEYIELSNFSKEVTVNPYIDPKEIKTQVRGKRLKITLPPNLLDNTTYTINFGKSLIDITERNPNDSLVFSFSTGDNIDSLLIFGSIIENESLSPTPDVLVGLYTLEDTINPVKHKATYYTKTRNLGKFKFQSLPLKKFKIFAFKDENKNFLFDSLSEQIAFHPYIISSSDTINPQLNLFKEDHRKFEFNRPKFKDGYIDLTFKKGVANIKESNLPYLYNSNTNTLRLYSSEKVEESIQLSLLDSNSYQLDTTFTISASRAQRTDYLLNVSQILENHANEPFPGIVLKLDHKINEINYDSLYIIQSKDTLPFNKTDFNLEKSNFGDTLFISSKSLKTDTISLLVKDSAFISLSNHYNHKSVTYTYIKTDKENFGQILGQVTTEEENYFLLLLDSRNEIISKLKNPKSINYQYVKPGIYSIKIIVDKNNNNTYDTGSLSNKVQPETVITYGKAINVKANWEYANINIIF